MKKFLISFISIVAVISLFLGSALSASASKLSLPGWGTEEEGIIPKFVSYPAYHTPWTETNGFPNADFEKGLLYWSSTDPKEKPAEVVKVLTEENGNKCVQFTATNNYDGIESISFRESRVKAGDELCVVFDWKGEDGNFQVYCEQIVYKDAACDSWDAVFRISHNGDAKRGEIINGGGGDDWNVGYCKPEKPVKAYYDANPYYYFRFGVQAFNDPSVNAIVDNVRLGKFSASTNTIYDLDGKVMYDLNNLKIEEGEEILTEEMFPNIDYSVTYDDVYGNKKDVVKIEKEEDTTSKAILWVIIGCGAIIVIAIAVLIIVLIVKKKNKKKTIESEDTTEECEEPSEETEKTEEA